MNPKRVVQALNNLADRLTMIIIECETIARALNPDNCPTFYSAPMAWADVLRGMQKSVKTYRDRFYAIVEGGK